MFSDIEITGDTSWPCADHYVNPILAEDPGANNDPTPENTAPVGQWFVDFTPGKERCWQSCNEDAPSCGRGRAARWETLYDSAAQCCQERLQYKNLGHCVGQSLGTDYEGSGKYYVDNERW